MPDENPAEVVTTTETPAEQPEVKAPTADDIAKLQAALDKERGLRKTYESAAKEAENQRKASMTEAERAVLEAEERGRLAAVTAYGQRLAQTEFRAAAAAVNPEYDVAKALKYVNLAGLLGEDGEPDSKAIAAAVADLVPPANTGPTLPPSFDGGARQAAPAGASMSDLIRKAAGRA
jgi:predicted secreted protein